MDETEDVNLDTPNETAEESVEPLGLDLEVAEEETPETPDVEKLQATNKKLYERAKKAEADLKALKGTKPPQATPQLDVEETVLLATGLPEELLGELKAIAQVRKTSLIKAQNDPIFIAVKEQFEKDKKKEDASLPAARGSGAVKPKKDTTTPGLSREEHMKLAREAMNA